MTAPQFTPGPWHWKEGLGREEMPVLIGGDGLPVCDFGMETPYYPVEGTPPEEADANLIAAAPELYEALRALRSALSSGVEATQKTITQVDAALAKARGEQVQP